MIFGIHGGKGRVVLAGGKYFAGNLAWRPDGKAAVYAFRANGADHIGLADLVTGTFTPWTHAAPKTRAARSGPTTGQNDRVPAFA